MRWDIITLVQNVNLICAKKVYYFNRPKYFFLCVNSRITNKILKLVLDRVSNFEGMKQTILLFEIHSSGFVFYL